MWDGFTNIEYIISRIMFGLVRALSKSFQIALLEEINEEMDPRHPSPIFICLLSPCWPAHVTRCAAVPLWAVQREVCSTVNPSNMVI